MIGVDLIGEIRCAYFEQRSPIKAIVRRLAVSRATVRRVIRSQKTEFKYQRGVQPAPKLGEWVAVLSEMLEKEARLPRRERRSTQPRPALAGCVAELTTVQAQCVAWLQALPTSLHESTTAEALQEICDLNLSELEAVEPPRGFGRD